MFNKNFGLYLILTDPQIGYEQLTEIAIQLKIPFLQLRMKEADENTIISVAKKLRKITMGSSTKLIINDSVKIARQVDADGVHLGQDDMTITEARHIWTQPNKIFGLSTHNLDQVNEANTINPDYIGIGPVFKTPTKKIADPPLGFKLMQEMINIAKIPTVILGSIDYSNLEKALNNGANNYSTVRDINRSQDPRTEIIKLQNIWLEQQNRNNL